jgi:hypothetical protein
MSFLFSLSIHAHARNSKAGLRSRRQDKGSFSLIPLHFPIPSVFPLASPAQHTAQSYNRLQLPRIPERVLNHRATGTHDILVRRPRLGLLLREVDAAVLGQPAARLRKLHHGALGVEEQQVLGVGDGQRRVGALRAGCDFGADGGDEDLRWKKC